MPQPQATEAINYRYGISDATIAIRTALGTYGTPWKERGAEEVTETRAEGGSTTFHSDNGNPATVRGAAGNDTLSVKFAEFSKKYKTDVLGHKVDQTTGGVLKGADDEGATFAFGYEVQGTSVRTRVWKFGCTSSEPAASAFQTNGENVTESPETCTVTVGGDTFGGKVYYEVVCHEGDPGFESFLDVVPTPSVASS